MTRVSLLFFFLVCAWGAGAQTLPAPGEGRSSKSRTWSWRDYQADNQNWGVAQDARGVVFVANTKGLLEYDGEGWRLHSMPMGGQALVRSVATGAEGRVFVGGVGDLGFLRSDSLGSLRYVSLRSHIPTSERDFADVWTTHVTKEGVVFQSASRLFRWDGRQMRSWSTATRFRTAFLVGGVVHVWEESVGIKALQGNRLELIPGGTAFADRKVDALLPHPRGLLAVVRDEGLVLIENGATRPIESEASDYLRTFRPYTAIRVPNLYARRGSLYAVATFGGGVAIIAPDGRLVRVYREDVGLSESDLAVGLRYDAQGGLWVATLNGVARIDLFSRLSWFGEAAGLVGSVYVVAEHEGTLYVGTDQGLFRQVRGRLGRPGAEGPAYAGFQQIFQDELPGQTWSLLSTPQGLLVGGGSGVHVIDRGQIVSFGGTTAFALLPSPAGSDRVFVGQADGVGVLDVRDGAWTAGGGVAGIEGETRSLIDDGRGGVWVAQIGGSLYRLSDLTAPAPTSRLVSTEGMSAGPLLRVRDEVWMFPREGAFALSTSDGRIRPVPISELRGVTGVYGLHQVGGGIWLSQGDVLQPIDAGRFPWTGDPVAFRNLKVIDLTQTDDGVVWIGTSDGLLRYDPRIAVAERTYVASVRNVTDRERTLLYGGALADGAFPTPVISHARGGQIRFEAAAPFFDAPGTIEYQFRLDGFDDDWGTWGAERVTSYTNLWEGTYTLRVRARDTYGHVSEEATFAIRILPPWYRAWWAYALYVVSGMALVWGISTWRVQENRRKLATQRARSARLQRLSTRLEKTNARLRQADRLKDDLLANTSHELRTPLTAILGFSEMLLDSPDDEARALAEGINRGGQRLLGTVNGLLDMFKLQSGTMQVEAHEVDAAALVRESVSLLQPLADAQGLDLHVLPESLSLPAVLDPRLLDRVVTNLAANAIKFTSAGRVMVLVDGDDQELRIAVRDTGIGIEREDIARIFEPFEQASTGFGRTHEGTGLGLPIVRRVLDLVGGRVTVESEPGQGTSFTVVVPRFWEEVEGRTSDGDGRSHPTLEGAHVLGMGLDTSTRLTLESWIAGYGTVCSSDTIGRTIREARKTVYDTVLLPASDAAQERKWTKLLRSVPGYETVPVLRVGGEGLSEPELGERGFFGQIETPLDATGTIELLESLLARVEATVA